MESIRGKQTFEIDAPELGWRLAGYRQVLIDIGTGDGRFVRHVAETHAGHLAIGIDACRENLRPGSRRAPANALYIIANALDLPHELYGLATWITINLPWGSLLGGLLAGEPSLVEGLAAIARPPALLEVRLNGGALAEAGWTLADGGEQIRRVLQAGGFAVRPGVPLGAAGLRACPTTWAKRLAFGRDPRALYLHGVRLGLAGQALMALTHPRPCSAYG